MSILIESAALITSVQDQGRTGYLRFGMPHSGPMDWWALRAANQLVGNSPGAACLEIGMTSCVLRMTGEALVSVCGSGFNVCRNHERVPMWMSFLVRPGDQLRIEKIRGGNWAYLGVSGGIQSEMWLGSRSTYPRGSLGQYLQDGDQLPLSDLSPQGRLLAGRNLPVDLRPSYQEHPLLRVIDGPAQNRFTSASLADFFAKPYEVSTQSDRMGYRLVGMPLIHREGADIISRGMVMGEIQVPGDGQPIVMMADHPTAGGYTSLGAVARVDWPLLAQAQPGSAHIKFTRISVPEAQRALIKTINGMEAFENEQEDLWLNL